MSTETVFANYYGEAPVIIYTNATSFKDTLEIKDEYKMHVKLTGVPDTLLVVAVSNGSVKQTHDYYTIKPKPNVDNFYLLIGYKESLNAEKQIIVYEKRMWMK